MSHRASSCPSRTYGGDALDIVGWVTLDNQSGKTFENAAIKLMAGDVSKVQLQQPDHLQFMRDAGSREVGQPPVTEKAFDEFHLYTLVRPATLRNREIKQVEFLRGERVTAKTAYCLPLPAGRTRFYRRDDDGRLEFTGENTIDHTPQGKTLLIYTGDAFDVVGERKRTDYFQVAVAPDQEKEVTYRVRYNWR